MTLPAWNEEVVLRHHETGTTVPVRVTPADGGLLGLVLTTRPARDLTAGPGDLECTGPGGVRRFSAAIVGQLAEVPPSVLVRVDGPPQVLQRREAFRVVAFLDVRIRVRAGLGAATETTTVDVSAAGMLIKDPLGLAPGTEVDIELDLTDAPSAPPIHATGRLVRVVRDDLKGVVIDAVADADRERLHRYVLAQERAERKQAREREARAEAAAADRSRA